MSKACFPEAKEAYFRMMKYGPEFVEGLARYAIFLAIVREPHRNLSEASNYAYKANQYANTKKDKRFVALAQAEIHVFQAGAKSIRRGQ